MKRFLGFICILYSLIISHVWIFNKLNNFLAPNMQIYIKISLFIMIFMGLILLLNNKVDYKFKISDLILILPLIMLISSGDGKLTTTLANNRMTNYKIEEKIEEEKTKEEDKKIEEEKIKEPNIEEQYDFSNPYFDITDETYGTLANYITFEKKSSKYIGKTIRLKGFAIKDESYLPEGYFAIGKYEITGCAAHASFAGFIAKYDTNKIEKDKWYEVEGIIEASNNNSNGIKSIINVINIKEVNDKSENQYVYPCYSYGDGSCSSIMKYNLEY